MPLPPFLTRWLAREGWGGTRNPGRDLAMIRVRNDRAFIRAKAREMRAELGLPPHPALEN